MFDNLGQHSIAAYLETKGFVAKVYSGVARDIHTILTHEIREHHVPVLGFYTATDNLAVTEHIIKWIKANFQVYVLVGGPEAVALKQDFLERTGCDYVIEGEGEIPIYQLLSKLIDNIGSIDSVYSIRYLDDHNYYHENNIAPLIYNLDQIPFPSMKRCLTKNFRNKNTFGIITGRGCPYNCAFCYEGANTKKVRLRSIENVIGEIDFAISENPKLKYLNIYDDTFTLNLDRVIAFCKEIKKRRLFWYCEGHVQNLIQHPELISIMVDAGMIGLQVGIESGSLKVLTAYRKQTTPKMLLEIVRLCKEAGLTRLVGNFILGGAFETESTIIESMQLAKKMLEIGKGMFECKTVFLAPYPQTSISLNPEKYDLELKSEEEVNSIFSMKSPLMRAKGITEDRLIALKVEFDLMIQKTIKKLSETATCKEVYNNFLKNGATLTASSIWKDEYLKQEHIVNFVEGMYSTLNKSWSIPCDSDLKQMYPIRTFHLYKELNNKVVYQNIIFEGVKAQLLKYAIGKFSFEDISKKYKIPICQLIDAYKELFSKCYIYASEF